MIRAVDVGFGSVKAIGNNRSVEYPSAVGNFRPVSFAIGIEGKDFGIASQELKSKLCVEYEGKRFFIGEIAYNQSSPRVTMSRNRFTSKEGMAVMLSALVLLSEHQHESIKLVTGLPVNEFSELEEPYQKALLGKHNIQVFKPDGNGGKYYAFDIQDVKILQQPIGTIFDAVLDSQGEIDNRNLASKKIGVVDIGKYTVDLCVMKAFDYIEKSSTSYNDIGLFDACKDLSKSLKGEGYDIPPDSIEPYLRNNKPLNGLAELKDEIFELQAEKIISRVLNMWNDIWSFDQVYITGGGAILFGEHLKAHFEKVKVSICEQPTMSNCSGYYKYGSKAWGLN